MSNDQFVICFIMALAFILANDYIVFVVWYLLYKDSFTIDNFLWWEWTTIFMVFYVAIRMLAVRFGWASRGHILPER